MSTRSESAPINACNMFIPGLQVDVAPQAQRTTTAVRSDRMILACRLKYGLSTLLLGDYSEAATAGMPNHDLGPSERFVLCLCRSWVSNISLCRGGSITGLRTRGVKSTSNLTTEPTCRSEVLYEPPCTTRASRLHPISRGQT